MQKHLLYLIAVTASVSTQAHAEDKVLPLLNPSFEQQLSGWKKPATEEMSYVVEAAHSGKYGLRVTDNDEKTGSSLLSERISIILGKRHQLRFWARAVEGEGVAVYLRFLSPENKVLSTQEAGNEVKVLIPKKAVTWRQFSIDVPPVEGASKIEVWIHSFSTAVAVADIDDITVIELDD